MLVRRIQSGADCSTSSPICCGALHSWNGAYHPLNVVVRTIFLERTNDSEPYTAQNAINFCIYLLGDR